jgi:hypothetical protein
MRYFGSFNDFPLSGSQKAIWLGEKLDPETNAFRIPLLIEILGPLNQKALKNALSTQLRQRPRSVPISRVRRTRGGSRSRSRSRNRSRSGSASRSRSRSLSRSFSLSLSLSGRINITISLRLRSSLSLSLSSILNRSHSRRLSRNISLES